MLLKTYEDLIPESRYISVRQVPFRGEGKVGEESSGENELHRASLRFIQKGMRAVERIQTTVAQQDRERKRVTQGTPARS